MQAKCLYETNTLHIPSRYNGYKIFKTQVNLCLDEEETSPVNLLFPGCSLEFAELSLEAAGAGLCSARWTTAWLFTSQ